MKGTYRVLQDGIIISETENLITTAGKSHIIKYLAGYVGSIAKGIAVGVDNTAATVGDTNLGLEWMRFPVDLTTVDYLNTAIIFKGKIPSEYSGAIYEMGLWSAMYSGGIYDSRSLLTFDSAIDTWTAGVWATTTQRIGTNSLRLAPATSAVMTATLADTWYDLSGYSSLDEFRLAYSVNSAFVATAKLILYTDASNYYTYTITAPTAGYKITPFYKSNFVATGIPNWASITSMAVQVTSTSGGSGSIDFDGLRLEDMDTNSELFSLVSRAIPSVPVIKVAGMPLDFEYSLDVTL